jgi:co-chaperonin GroES (HSP10)
MPIAVPNLTPTRGTVLVTNIEQGDKMTRGGIIILDDNGKERGIRERWAQIWSKHPDIEDVEIGDWILIKHGRWSRGIDITDGDGAALTIRKVDWPDGVLLSCVSNPLDL